MRVAILVCSTDSSGFSEQFPNDGEKFVALFGPIRPDWSFHAVPVVDDVLPGLVEDYDAYIVTGSPKSNTASDPWVARLHAFIRKVHAKRVPMLGICFGHQAIAEALGGRLQPNPGESETESFHVGVAAMRVCAREGWMEPWRDTLRLYTAHSEQVTNMPAGARLLAWHPRCPVAMMAVDDHMLSVEFHPESYRDFMRAMIVSRADELDGAFVEEKLHEVEGETDGPVLAGWMASWLDMARGAEMLEAAE